MNNYLIQYNSDYGIMQTDKTFSEVKFMFSKNVIIKQFLDVREAQQFANELSLNYVGYDMFLN
jgi:hypothetical protein